WIPPKRCQKSWLPVFPILFVVRDWWMISLPERSKAQRENIRALQFAENVHLRCWQKAIRRRRFGSNTFGMRSLEGMTQILFVGISGVLFRARKTTSSLKESAPNTRPFMDVHSAISQ